MSHTHPMVLIADSKRERVLELSLALSARGIAVYECDRVRRAIHTLESHSFAAAFVSWDLPVANSADLVRALTSAGTGTIIVAEPTSAPSSAEAVRAGALDLVLDPVDSESLASHLDFIVSEARLLRTA